MTAFDACGLSGDFVGENYMSVEMIEHITARREGRQAESSIVLT